MNTQTSSTDMLSDILAEPLNGVKAARIEIDSASGNLIVDRLTGGEPLLASGSLQYSQKQGAPVKTLESSNGQTTFTVKVNHDTGRPWFRLPWAACNGAHEWQIRLNPAVSLDIKAHSGGGNVRIDLTGMDVTGLSADTGGGSMDVFLPTNPDGLNATIKSGAGNVTVYIPDGIEARIHAATGLGKVIVDPRFNQVDKGIFQSAGCESAAHPIEITANSGAGNVIIQTLRG
jgi:hypothetical protein